MEINHKIKFADGPFETETGEIICVANYWLVTVNLCFKANKVIPFAEIKLHSEDLLADAKATFEDASKLGEEIAHRWNVSKDYESKWKEQNELTEKWFQEAKRLESQNVVLNDSTLAERSILNAMYALEAMPGNEELTKAMVMLSEVKKIVENLNSSRQLLCKMPD